MEQKATERALYVDEQLGRITEEMASLSKKVDSAFRAIMNSAEATAKTTDRMLRALIAKGIMEMGPQAAGELQIANTESTQRGSQRLNDVGEHQ